VDGRTDIRTYGRIFETLFIRSTRKTGQSMLTKDQEQPQSTVSYHKKRTYMHVYLHYALTLNIIQVVALTGRNLTSPPWSVGRLTAHAARPPAALQTTDDDDRHQRPLLVWPAYTMCRRASNKLTTVTTDYTTHFT